MNLQNKKIIVTGGNGFLGEHVVSTLKEEVPEENIFIPKKENYDLTKKEEVKKLFNDFAADVVIHLAAHGGGIGYYKEHPGTIFYKNVVMGLNLIEEARKNNVEKIVIIGTGIAYPKEAQIPYKEEDFWKGYPEETGAPYGMASKILLTQLNTYKKEYNFNGIYLIPANLYGPGDHFNPEIAHVIPSLILKINTALKEKKTNIEMWGSGNASREFLYVKDAAKAIVLATKSYEKTEPLNIGTGISTPLKEIVEIIRKMLGYNGEIIWDSTKPEGQLKRCFDISKLKEELNFEAETPLKKGLKTLIEWYKKNEIN